MSLHDLSPLPVGSVLTVSGGTRDRPHGDRLIALERAYNELLEAVQAREKRPCTKRDCPWCRGGLGQP